RHHLEMMAPVIEELTRRNVACELVSLAELRGFETPKDSGARRAIPLRVRRRGAPRPGGRAGRAPGANGRGGRPGHRDRSGRALYGDQSAGLGGLARKLLWRLGLGPRLRWMLRKSRVIVVPNDSVYPYVELVGQLRGTGARTVLMQEGIRFQPPESFLGPRYG